MNIPTMSDVSYDAFLFWWTWHFYHIPLHIVCFIVISNSISILMSNVDKIIIRVKHYTHQLKWGKSREFSSKTPIFLFHMGHLYSSYVWMCYHEEKNKATSTIREHFNRLKKMYKCLVLRILTSPLSLPDTKLFMNLCDIGDAYT